jgi:putative chitinase
MEIEINDTAATTDDMVALHDNADRPTVPCRIRAISRSVNAKAELSNPDGRLRFPGAGQETVTVSLPDDGSWAAFAISGEMASAAAGDALIEVRCTKQGRPLKTTAVVTVCGLRVTTETEQIVPTDRARLRLGVEERVTLTASGALGAVRWQIAEGDGTLSDEAGPRTVYQAHALEQTARIEALDQAGCTVIVTFDVDCNYLLSRARTSTLFPNAPDDRVNAITDAFNEFYETYELTDCLRRSHFFAQVRTEVGGSGEPRREGMNYTPPRLLEIFSYYRRNPAEADLHGRTAAHAANQPAIGNRVYANRLGNGDIASGDGSGYRGRGFLQLTGRANYQAIQNEIDANTPGSGVDIVANPDQAIEIRGGMLSAMAFWSRNNANNQADDGSANADIDGVSNIVNRWGDHAERRQNFRNVSAPAFHLDDCPR